MKSLSYYMSYDRTALALLLLAVLPLPFIYTGLKVFTEVRGFRANVLSVMVLGGFYFVCYMVYSLLNEDEDPETNP